MGLLEVLVAIVILAVAGLAAMQAVADALSSEARLGLRERELADADRLLSAYSVLGRRDLDLRLGTRVVGDWSVEVQRPRPALYRVSLARADASDVEVLVTVLFRPASQ
jgi:type II secretory pathway component PulJ